ncbi:MAG: HupE/UreJ family protein [Myxococcota bacterium]
MSAWARHIRSRLALVVLAFLVCGPDDAARAHPLAPSLLELREESAGRFSVLWKTPLMRPTGSRLEPSLPASCRPRGRPLESVGAGSLLRRWQVECGSAGLVGGLISVSGLEASRSPALVRIEFEDRAPLRALLRGDQSALRVPPPSTSAHTAWRYARLGLDHILSGFDHLLLLVGLVSMISGARRLLITITFFTLGHSLTLALAALDWMWIAPAAPIETMVAATLLYPALVLARSRASSGAGARSDHAPAMALVFGLLHGLAFATGLREVGLPAGELPQALLGFNVGIEAGQLLCIGAVVGLRRSFSRLFRTPVRGVWLRWLPAYTLGSLAAMWFLERALASFQLLR